MVAKKRSEVTEKERLNHGAVFQLNWPWRRLKLRRRWRNCLNNLDRGSGNCLDPAGRHDAVWHTGSFQRGRSLPDITMRGGLLPCSLL